MIRTTYPDRICYRPGYDVHECRVLLPDGVAPDRGVRRASSWGIRMELLRIAMRAPCHQGKGSLHLAHADGPPYDAWHSSFHLGRNSVRPTINILRISHIRNSVWPTFHLLWISHIRNSVQSNMSGSSDSAYPESICSRQFRFPRQLGSSDTRNSSDPFPPTIKKQTLIILTTKSPFCTVQRNFS